MGRHYYPPSHCLFLMAGRKNRLSHHTVRFGNAKLREYRRSDVGKRRVQRLNRSIAEQHSRHEGVVHTLVATPRTGVVFENFRSEVAEKSLPACTITSLVAHQKIGMMV